MIASPELPWQYGVFILVIYQWKETKGNFDSKNLSLEKWRCSLDLGFEMEFNWY